jgi:hypothetical protein
VRPFRFRQQRLVFGDYDQPFYIDLTHFNWLIARESDFGGIARYFFRFHLGGLGTGFCQIFVHRGFLFWAGCQLGDHFHHWLGLFGQILGHTAQIFGFAPAEYTRQLEINASTKNIEKRALKERTKLLRDYYIAARVGDSEGMSEAIEGMLKFSGKHPGYGITAETIKNSMAQHMKTSREMYHGVTLNKNLRSELLQHASEFDEE